MFKLEIDECERFQLRMALEERLQLMERIALPREVEECKRLLEKLSKLRYENYTK